MGPPDPSRAHMTLEERLRNLEWPKPPPGVKERLLEDLMRRLDEQKAAEAAESNEHDRSGESKHGGAGERDSPRDRDG